MGLFNQRRSDGIRIRTADPMLQVMPYLMRNRNESVVYYKDTIDIENMQRYIREKRGEGTRITLFNIIITALLHLIFQRPHLNRFIAGRRLYAHDSFDVLYVVKTSLGDDSNESVARVSFNENDNIFTVTKAMKDIIDQIKANETEKGDDKLIRLTTACPRWMIRSFAGLLRWADFHGFLPRSLTKLIPMYSSCFVSHLGSIGGGAPFHHLYEFGTISIFITIGKVYEKPFKGTDNSVEWRKVVDLAFSIDERICDGYYLIKSLKLFNQLVQSPGALELSPAAWKRLTPEEQKELKKKLRHTADTTPDVLDREEISDRHEMA